MKKNSLIVLTLILIITLGCSQPIDQTNVEESTQKKIESDAITGATVKLDEFLKHNAPEDCWIVYEGKVYDYSDAPRHPNMDKTFFAYCGKTTGFEQGAKAKHASSSEDRVSNFGTYLGEVGK